MILGVFLGVFSTVFLASSHIMAYNLGKRSRKTTSEEEISEYDLKRIKKMNEGFANIMNYSVDVALGKGE